MSTRLGTSATPRTFAVIAAAAFASAGVASTSFQAEGPGVVSVSRLGVTGTPRADTVTSFESGTLVAQGGATVSFDSSTVESLSALSSSGVGETSFVGASTAAGALDSLGRSIPSLAGGATVDSALSSVLSVDVDFRSGTAATALSVTGIPGKWRFIAPKEAVDQRDWQVNETLGLSIAIGDFTERAFELVDDLGISFDPTAFYGQSALVSSGSATVSFSGQSTRAATLAAAGSAALSLVGANVSVNESDWTSDGAATVSFQGSEAGTVFGTGRLGSIGVSTASFVGRSYHESSPAMAGLASVSFAASSTFASDLSSAGSAVVEFFYSTNAVLSSSGAGAVSFGGASTFAAQISAAGLAVPTFVGHRLGGTPLFTLNVASEGDELVPAEEASFAVIFEPSEIVVP